MVKVYHFQKKKFVAYAPRESDVEALVKKLRGGFKWVDVQQAGEKRCASIGNIFKLHQLTIDDCIGSFQTPKLEVFSEYLYIVFHGISKDQATIKKQEVDFVLSNDTLISLHREKGAPWWNDAVTWVQKRHEIVSESGPDFLLHHFLERLVDTQAVFIDDLHDRIEKMERDLLKEKNGDVPSKVLVEKRLALRLHRSLSPQRDILGRLGRPDTPFILSQNIVHFRDVADLQQHLAVRLDTARDLLSNIMELSLAQSTSKTNDIMKVLTVISTMILPLTLITGIYGMNFHFMPELESRFGYPLVLASMVLIATVMIFVFRRKKWL